MINLQLKKLERKELIKRVKERDPNTRHQRPTYYVLGFELDGRRNGSGKHLDYVASPEQGSTCAKGSNGQQQVLGHRAPR